MKEVLEIKLSFTIAKHNSCLLTSTHIVMCEQHAPNHAHIVFEK
jgi:hypothetical protein